MGWWQVTADTLAGSRFVVSPMAETVACLINLSRGMPGHLGERAWLSAHEPAYRELVAQDPVLEPFVHAALNQRRWIADFLAGVPSESFTEELSRIQATPPDAVRADLEVALNGPVPAILDRCDLAERAADLLCWVWERIEPDWPRRRRVLEADIVARTRRLSREGWSSALDDIRPGIRWLGEGRLQVNTYDRPSRDLTGARLLFTPVTPHHGWVAWDEPSAYAVIYPCAGVLAEPPATRVPEALGRLLGRARAGVLMLLDEPKSTTQLVALTGQGLGSVGRHLSVLHDANLITRRRSGHSVLYYRTDAGDILVRAQR